MVDENILVYTSIRIIYLVEHESGWWEAFFFSGGMACKRLLPKEQCVVNKAIIESFKRHEAFELGHLGWGVQREWHAIDLNFIHFHYLKTTKMKLGGNTWNNIEWCWADEDSKRGGAFLDDGFVVATIPSFFLYFGNDPKYYHRKNISIVLFIFDAALVVLVRWQKA